MPSLIEALGSYLDAQAAGTFDPTGANPTADIFVGEEPPTPDNLIAILATAGGNVDKIQEDHLVEIRVRDLVFETGESRLRAVQLLLHETGGTLGGVRMRVTATSPYQYLGRDASGPGGGRFRFSQLYRAVALINLG